MRTLARFFGLASGLLVTAGVLLVSCAPDTTAPTLQSRPTNAPPATEDATAANVVDVVMESVPPFTDTACLDCHSDQPAMVELAQPKDSGHGELSSGPG